MIKYEVDPEQTCLLAQARGELSRECLRAHWSAARHASEIRNLDALYDFREVDTVTVSVAAVHDLAREVAARPNERKIALVAERSVVYGMSRMFQTLAEDKLPNLRIFRELEPALEYLELA